MPSQNMLPKGKRRHSVKQEYRAQRTAAQERAATLAEAEKDDAPKSWSTADFAAEPAATVNKSPWAHKTGLVTSGPESGKLPPEQDTQSTPRYGTRYVAEPERVEVPVLEELEPEDGVRAFTADAAAAGMRLDAYLAKAIPEISRARVVLLIDNAQVRVDGKGAKASLKLKGGEAIEIEGDPQPAPLNAVAEDIPLRVVFEDADMAVIDKPAGMMVHAGSGAPEHNRGTLVNALLHHFGGKLSSTGGELRPGIVHRLDKQTSGLIVVAKNDVTHRALAEMFSTRQLRKVYLALVHGHLPQSEGTVQLPISRDLVRRTRMTTKRTGPDARSAVSHWRVVEEITGPFGEFSLVEVRIETGRTHQIRVHMQALGHPVVGDFLYGAPHRIRPVVAAKGAKKAGLDDGSLELERNFLHAAELDLPHPRTGEPLELRSGLPEDLVGFLEQLR